MCVVDKLVKVDILVLRPSPLSVFDCLQYAKQREKAWGFLPCDLQHKCHHWFETQRHIQRYIFTAEKLGK